MEIIGKRDTYGAILADPPWHFDVWSFANGPGRHALGHYRTMSTEIIKRMPVTRMCAKDAVLFLWVSWPMLEQGLDVIRAWGFTYKTCGFSWMKTNGGSTDVWAGTGYWTRANSEVCLLATRGKPKRLNADVRQGIIESRREHSRKPDCVHDRIERLVAGPYLELFARQSRQGWTTLGDEATKFDAIQGQGQEPGIPTPAHAPMASAAS